MSEPGLRRLDKGLPRIEMYLRKPKPDPVRASPARAERATVLHSSLTEAKQLLEMAQRDRAEAALALAEAREHASLIIAEAQIAAKSFASVASTYPARQSVADIIRETAERYGVTVGALKGPGRNRHMLAARREAMVLVRTVWPELSSAAMGRLFNRDHTSVLHLLRRAGVR